MQSQSTVSLPHILSATLVEKGLLSLDQVDIATKEQRLQGIPFEECLLTLGFISEGALAEVRAALSGHDKIDLKQTLFDPTLKTFIPRSLAEEHGFIPLSLEEDVLRIAVGDAYNLRLLDLLRTLVKEVIPFIAPESDILEAIDHYYGYDTSIRGVIKEIEASAASSLARDDTLNPTIRLVNTILGDAIKSHASDIHFEPEGAFIRLRYRIDGILTQICTLHSSYWPAVCVRLKVMSEMNIAENRKPQNGRITFYIGPREIDLRVSSHPTIHGENIVVRILDKSRSLLPLEALGYSENVLSPLKKALQKPEGIFIMTGPTGCGKTTSLYSLLDRISTPALNIMTLEEPVEYTLPLVRQSDIRELGGIDFAEGVRSILRQDPDIILIGEIRDPPTAHMALRAAMTGHQVFSTLHTNDSLGALFRLMDLGLSPITLAGTLTAIVAQRLVRLLCPACKQEKKATAAEKDLLKAPESLSLFNAQGCATCQGTGYRGRGAIAEILTFDEELQDLLSLSSPRHVLKKSALKRGYVPLAHEARRQVLQGHTSLSEALRVVDLKEIDHDAVSL